MRVPGGSGLGLFVAVGIAVALGLYLVRHDQGDDSIDEFERVEDEPVDEAAVLVGRHAPPVPPAPGAPDPYAVVTDVRVLVRASYAGGQAQMRLVALARSSPDVLPELVDWLRPEHDADRSMFRPSWRSQGVPGLETLYDTLAKLAPESAAVLAEALGDEDDDFRRRVALCLGRMGESAAAAVPALIARLAPGAEDVAGEVAVLWALGKIGEAARPALPLFQAYLKDDRFHDDARAAAAEGFLQLAGPTHEAFETCSVALRDQSFEICARLVPAIGDLGADGAPMVPELLALIQDPLAHGLVRRHAVHAVGRVGSGSKAAISTFTALVTDPDAEDAMRAAAILALARLGPEAQDALFRTLGSADVETKFLAVQTLCELEAAERVEPRRLLAVLDTVGRGAEAEDRAEAVWWAGRIEGAGEALVPWLVAKLEGTEAEAVRRAALEVLSEQPDATGRIVKLLLSRLEDPDPSRRAQALQGLARRAEEDLGDFVFLASDEVTKALLARLEDAEYEVRVVALGTLELRARGNPVRDERILNAVLRAFEDEARGLRYEAAYWILANAPRHGQRTLPFWIDRVRNGDWAMEAWPLLKEAGPKAKEALPALHKLRAKMTYAPLRKQLDEVIAAIQGP